jgi:uncharacterized damage-inducible protein DinB
MNDRYAAQIQRCETQLNNFLAEVLTSNPPVFDVRINPSKWSAHENLAHLAQYHEVFMARLGRILSEDNPDCGRYSAEKDPRWEDWRKLPSKIVLEKLKTLRTELLRRLRELSDDDFQRTGVHSRFGKLTLAQWLEFFLVHEAHHLYLVFQQVND